MIIREQHIPYILILGLFLFLAGSTASYWHDMLALQPTDQTFQTVSAKPQPTKPTAKKVQTQVLNSTTKKTSTPSATPTQRPTPQTTPSVTNDDEKKQETDVIPTPSIVGTESSTQPEPTAQSMPEAVPENVTNIQRSIMLPDITARLPVEIPDILHL